MENRMIEVKFVGSGGQGSVVAGKLLADAGARVGYHCQSFAAYGALRRGGQVESFVRFSMTPIRIHSKMYDPDYLVLMDDKFVQDTRLIDEVKNGGTILINTSQSGIKDRSRKDVHIYDMDARKIALEADLSLPSGMPVINTAVLGGLAAFLPDVGVDSIIEAVDSGKIPHLNKNASAIRKAYQSIKNTLEGKTETGSASYQIHSDYKQQLYPVIDEQCNLCELCYISCPDIAIFFNTDANSFEVNNSACKECGICIRVCPRKSISWERGAV